MTRVGTIQHPVSTNTLFFRPNSMLRQKRPDNAGSIVGTLGTNSCYPEEHRTDYGENVSRVAMKIVLARDIHIFRQMSQPLFDEGSRSTYF